MYFFFIEFFSLNVTKKNIPHYIIIIYFYNIITYNLLQFETFSKPFLINLNSLTRNINFPQNPLLLVKQSYPRHIIIIKADVFLQSNIFESI